MGWLKDIEKERRKKRIQRAVNELKDIDIIREKTGKKLSCGYIG